MPAPRDPEGNEARTLAALVDWRGLDLLEVGAGDGRLTWTLAAQARSVLAIDPDEEAIAAARAACPPALSGRVELRAGDVLEADLGEAAFDLAVLARSL